MREPGKVNDRGQYLLCDGRVSNFSTIETTCRNGCGLILVGQAVIEMAQRLRDQFGVMSGFSGVRCPTHNADVDGKLQSQHLPDEDGVGHAMDITPRLADPEDVAAYFRKLYPHHGGLGIGKTFVHIDSRPERTDWRY